VSVDWTPLVTNSNESSISLSVAFSLWTVLPSPTDKQSYVDANTVGPALARKPVVITALAAGSGTYVYRFEVWDAFLGTITLRGFSADIQLLGFPVRQAFIALL